MRVQVEKLRQALQVVKPAVARKATLPIIQNVLVQDGRLHATNLDLYITVALPELGDEPFVFPARLMEKTLASLPGYETLNLNVANGLIELRTSRARFSLKGDRAEDFPPMPEAQPHEAEVDGDAFLAGLEQVRPYVSQEDARPVLQGVYVALGEPVEVAAADGFRLGWRTLPFAIAPRNGIAYWIIPATAVDVLAATWRAVRKGPALPVPTEAPHRASIAMAQLVVAPRPMKLTFSQESLSCRFGGVRVTTQLILGTFPKYKQLIPATSDKRVVVDGRAFAQALRQLAPVVNQGSGLTRLYWEDTAMRLVAQSEEAGTAEVRLSCSSQGGPAHIAFAINYLQEYFQDREGPVMLEVTSTSSPGVFTHRGERQLVVMPMFSQWEGEPVQSPAEASPPAATESHEPQSQDATAEAGDSKAAEDPEPTKPRRRRVPKAQATAEDARPEGG